MFKNYLKVALRSVSRSVSYTVINVAGLALGTTCAIMIFLLVNYHLSFETFHPNVERAYRFVTEQRRDQVSYSGSVPPAFGKTFREEFTYAELVTRIVAEGTVVSFDHKGTRHKFNEDFAFTDANYFELFNFPIVEGVNQLQEPGTAVVSERLAKKFFGDESAVGKAIRLDNRLDFTITAVMKDLPDNTDFRNELLLSMLNVGQWNEWYGGDDSWSGLTSSFTTYCRLQPGVDPAEVEHALTEYPKKYRPRSKSIHTYHLQPLTDIHFDTTYEGGRTSKTILVVLSVIGFFLVLTASLNFINLATAQALSRAREVGVRKVLGSMRAQLFWQFTMETFVIVAGSFLLSVGVCYTLIPMVNGLLESRISMQVGSYSFWLFSLGLVILLTFLSGAYPGVVLSGFKPVQALKGKLLSVRSSGLNLRRVLITAQFAISQVLLIGLIVVISQMQYFKTADLGFDHDAIVMVPIGEQNEKAQTLKTQLLQIPHVEKVTMCFSAPASQNSWGTSIRFDHRDENEGFESYFKGGDEDFISTFGIDLLAGRNLTQSDTIREFLVNETMVERLGETNEAILGKEIFYNGEFRGPIVGVINDFHGESLHNDITPVLVATQLDNFHEFAIKINMADMNNTLAAIDKTWSEIFPNDIYRYEFLDDQTAQFYRTEQQMLTFIEIFSFIALFIGGLGLYGLVSFMSVQKTKEIGIRKVLGGSLQHILWIFGKEFTTLIVLAFVVAAPIGWIVMSNWLGNFQYRIPLSPWIFVVNLLVIGFVALLTVGVRSAKAALMNPVNALRTE